MTPLADAEHFASSPDWTWYILSYFFASGFPSTVSRSIRAKAWLDARATSNPSTIRNSLFSNGVGSTNQP